MAKQLEYKFIAVHYASGDEHISTFELNTAVRSDGGGWRVVSMHAPHTPRTLAIVLLER